MVLLAVAAFSLPLRVPEILAMAGAHHLYPHGLFAWIAQSPDLAPLYYILQIPFTFVAGVYPIGVRLLPLAFAAASCFAFFRLAREIPLAHPYLALIVFMLFPMHVKAAIEGRPIEQALFLLIVASIAFLRLVRRPGTTTAVHYAVLLTLCLYTYLYFYLAGIGYALFLFRFVNRSQERKAMWYTLAATVAPVLLYLPYYFWARPQVSAGWFAHDPASSESVSPVIVALALTLGVGTIGAIAASWRMKTASLAKRIGLFSLAGGVVSAVGISAMANSLAGQEVQLAHWLGALPAAVLLLFATLEWLLKNPRKAGKGSSAPPEDLTSSYV